MNLGITIIKSRHSVRKFRNTPLDEPVIHDALDCARLAPTARNEQPWLFGVVRDPQIRSRIAALTEHGKFIADAPVCFAVFGEKDATYYLEDCCAATENLIIGLQSHGVGSCWVAGEKKAYAGPVRELLGVPLNYTLVSLVAAGYPGDITITRKKDPDEVIFFDLYNPEKA
jgi:nitroreductase